MQKDPNCIFCKIVARDIPAATLLEAQDFIAIADINPQAPHHMLVMPKEHIANISEMTDTNLTGRLFEAACQLAKQVNLDNGFRLVVNTGSDGGQTVDHLHVHVLGGRTLGWPPG